MEKLYSKTISAVKLPTERGEILEQVDQLFSNLDVVQKSIAELRDHLNPILAPETPMEAATATPAELMLTDLGGRLAQVNRSITNINELLRETNRRIGL